MSFPPFKELFSTINVKYASQRKFGKYKEDKNIFYPHPEPTQHPLIFFLTFRDLSLLSFVLLSSSSIAMSLLHVGSCGPLPLLSFSPISAPCSGDIKSPFIKSPGASEFRDIEEVTLLDSNVLPV